MKLFCRAFLLFFAAQILGPSTTFCSQIKVDFDPGIFVGWNDLVVEGVLVHLTDVEPRELSWSKGFLYPGQEGKIQVNAVKYNKTEFAIMPGDTITLFNRTSNKGINNPAKPGIIMELSGTCSEITVQVGSRGLFGVDTGPSDQIRPGIWFFCSGKRAEKILEFMKHLAADSTGVVSELSSRYPRYRLKF